MANGYGNDLVPGGMGLDPGVSTAVPLDISPDIDASVAAGRLLDNRYRNIYNPLAPSFSPVGQAAQTAQTPQAITATAPTNFDMGFGDSIAVQQISSNIPGVGARRMWGWAGPQYNAKNPAPFDIWHTAGVGDPPSRIRERAIHAVEQNSDFFRDKNVFLPIGSNVEGASPDHVTGIDAVKDMLSMLDGAGVGRVVIPGVGPGVQNGAAWNTAVQKVVGDMNDPRFVFFQPQVNWARDGVHPNSQQMFDQANAALSRATPQTDQPSGSQPAPATAPASLQPQPPGSAPQNALAPPGAQPSAPASAPSTAPAAPAVQWGDFIRGHEGLLNDVVIGGDVGHDTVGYGHLVTGEQEMPGSKNSDRGRGYIRGLDEQGNEVRVPIGPISTEQANQIFEFDTEESANAWRKEIPNFDNLTPLQKEALISYHYNTGKTIPGMADVISKGDFNAASNMLRNGIATVHGQPNAVLAGRRTEEAQMMLNQYVKPRSIQTQAWTPGQGRPYVAEGGLSIPPSNALALPQVAVNAPQGAQGGGPYRQPPEAQSPLDNPAMRRALILSMLGASLKGMTFAPVRSGYDPFKVEEAAKPPPVHYTASMGSAGGLGVGITGFQPTASPVSPAKAASPSSISPQRAGRKVEGSV